MAQTVFDSDLGDFCIKAFVVNPKAHRPSSLEVRDGWKNQERRIFEHLLLFEKLVFRVEGDSVIVPILLNMLGERGLDSLVDQGAIGFVLWDQNPVYLVQNVTGIDSIASMRFSNPAHSDPEASIDSGLRWMKDAPLGRRRNQIIRKFAKLYSLPDKTLTERAVNLTKEAVQRGTLSHLGIPQSSSPMDTFNDSQKDVAIRTARVHAEYSYLLSQRMTSFNNYQLFSPFWRSAEHFQQAYKATEGYPILAKLEGVPNLAALFDNVADPLQRLPTIRGTRSARQFREWLATTPSTSPDSSLTQAYLDAISERKGIFSTLGGKAIRSIAMASVGSAVGIAVGNAELAIGGAAVGSVIDKAIGVGTDASLNMFDSTLLEELLKGWSPRMFFKELSQLQKVHRSG